jgi:hypothetical protein
MTTERADFRFSVKEGDDGKPWIAFEPSGRQLTSIKGASAHTRRDGRFRLRRKSYSGTSAGTGSTRRGGRFRLRRKSGREKGLLGRIGAVTDEATAVSGVADKQQPSPWGWL